jgi:predicted ester cyclase
MEADPTYAAFVGARALVSGALRDVLSALKTRFDRDRSELVLVFDEETGRQVDFDLRGSLDDVLARAAPARRPGRPRLGVTSREVSLLPRHWEWLERQASGCSGALRKLVERAGRQSDGEARARRIRAALSSFLSAMAGDRPHYEEATRALWKGELDRFAALIQRWPKDVRDYALDKARAAAAADHETDPTAVVSALYRLVWSDGSLAEIPRLVAARYRIHADPGDPWEGKTVDRAAYAERVEYARRAFPDLTFTIDELFGAGDRVTVRWHAEGTQAGDLPGVPATGRRLGFAGQTIYAVEDGQVTGHWQVVDRLGFAEQLRPKRSARQSDGGA